MKTADVIKASPTCVFMRARLGVLHYQAGAFTFRVPIDELGDAEVNATDRTATFMRWISKEIAYLGTDTDSK